MIHHPSAARPQNEAEVGGEEEEVKAEVVEVEELLPEVIIHTHTYTHVHTQTYVRTHTHTHRPCTCIVREYKQSTLAAG